MEPEWDNRWHTIGLNWIDRNSQAHIIYELYLCVLQPFLVALEQRLRALLVPPYIINFFIQLFTKSTTEILYCLLIKHNNKKDLSTYRLEEEMRYRFTSILSEVMVSLLTTCLTEGCTGKLESIHVSAGDLFCPVCKTQYEVKSKSRLYQGSVTTFKAGTPPGIYNLIYGSVNPANPAQRGPPGRMLVIATNACELFEVSPLMARSVTVEGHPIRDRAGPWNLDDFSHFFCEYPGRSFREYETTLSVQPGQLVSIPLTDAAKAQLGELRSHLKFKILGQMLFDFQNDFREAVFAKGLRFLEMQDELSEARPQVILINENNLLDLKSMEEKMTELQDKCSKIIDCRIPRPEPGGAAAVWGSKRSDSRWNPKPSRDHTHDSQQRDGDGAGAAVWGSKRSDSRWNPKPSRDHTHDSQQRDGDGAGAAVWGSHHIHDPQHRHDTQQRDDTSAAHGLNLEPGGAAVLGSQHRYSASTGEPSWRQHKDDESKKEPVITNKIGTVRFYNIAQDYGYIEFEDGSNDFRFTSQNFSGFTLKAGNRVTLEFHNNKLHSIKKNRFGGGNQKNEEIYKEKYLKYKNKYIQLKSLLNTN